MTWERRHGAARMTHKRRMHMYWIMTFLIGVALIMGGWFAGWVHKQGEPDKKEEETVIASLTTTWMAS